MIQPLLSGLGKIPGQAGPGAKLDEQAADPLFAALMAMMFTQPQTGVPMLPLQPDAADSTGAAGVAPAGQGPAQALLAQAAGQLQQLMATLGQQANATPGAENPASEFLAKLAAILQGNGLAAQSPLAQLGQAVQPSAQPVQDLPAPLVNLQELVVKLEQMVIPTAQQPAPAAVQQVLDMLQNLAATQPQLAAALAATVAAPLTQTPPAPQPLTTPGTPARPAAEPEDKVTAADANAVPAAPAPGETPAVQPGLSKASVTPQPAQAVRTGRVRAAVENTAGKPQDPVELQPLGARPQGPDTAFAVEQAETVTASPVRQTALALTPDRLVQAVVNAAQSSPPGRYSVTVRLIPEHLGEVRLQLQLEGNKVQATMQVSNTGAQRALEEHGDQLRQGLDQRGLQLTGFTVSTGNQHQTPQDRQAQFEEWQQNLRRSGASQPVPAPAAPVAPREITPSLNGRRGNRLDTLA